MCVHVWACIHTGVLACVAVNVCACVCVCATQIYGWICELFAQRYENYKEMLPKKDTRELAMLVIITLQNFTNLIFFIFICQQIGLRFIIITAPSMFSNNNTNLPMNTFLHSSLWFRDTQIECSFSFVDWTFISHRSTIFTTPLCVMDEQSASQLDSRYPLKRFRKPLCNAKMVGVIFFGHRIYLSAHISHYVDVICANMRKLYGARMSQIRNVAARPIHIARTLQDVYGACCLVLAGS